MIFIYLFIFRKMIFKGNKYNSKVLTSKGWVWNNLNQGSVFISLFFIIIFFIVVDFVIH